MLLWYNGITPSLYLGNMGSIPIGSFMKVFVYYNLHKKCWSVKNVKTGLVIHHLDNVLLTHCECKVSEAGRQRVIKNRRKNVHAGIVGYLQPYNNEQYTNMEQITYNPYLYKTFISKETQYPIYFADKILLNNERKVYVIR